MVGFIIIPWLVRTQAPILLKEKFNLNIVVQSVTFNPFTFETTLNNLSLSDAHAKKLLDIKSFYLNYEPSYLFQKEIFVKSIRIDEPNALLQISPEGRLNLAELFSSPNPSENQTPTNASLPISFLVEQMSIQNGHLLFEDLSAQKPFSLPIGPINYTVNNFGLDKDDLSIHALEIALKNKERITLASSLSLSPLKLHGELTLTEIEIKDFWAYGMSSTKAQLTQGSISMRLPFWIDLSQKEPSFSIDKASLILNNLEFTDEKQHKIIAIPKLTLDALTFAWPQATGEIETLSLSEPFVDLTFEHGYIPTLVALFSPPKENQKATKEPSSSSSYSLGTLTLHSLKLDNGTLMLMDKNVKNGLPSMLSHLLIDVKNISTDTNQTISYTLSSTLDEKSSLALKGEYLQKTNALTSTLEATALILPKIQPYLSSITALRIKQGFLSLKGDIKASFSKTPTIAFNANTISIASLLIQDTMQTSFVAWEDLALNALSYTSSPNALHVKAITLTKPYINLDIHKDHTTNFTNIVTTTKEPKKTNASPMEFYIGKIILKDGHANFKDASLPIIFETYMNQLNGSFSTLNTKTTKPSILLVEGKVGKYGYTKVEGSLLPFDFKNHANLKLLFKNIDLQSLTPYSGKFLGYAIEKGKLSMDLSYTIKKGIMEGANKINLDTLTLGKKVESADASNLPLELAIALLQDSSGQIDIDLPVSGDLNNPDFKYGALVWKAFGNLIGGVITSPFKLLGSMLGLANSEGLRSIDFPVGEASLVASEEEKMDQYRQILEKKAELKLLITPSFNEEADTLALKNKELLRAIEAITGKDDKEKNGYGKAIKTLFIKKYSEKIYNQLLQTYTEEKRDRGYINEELKVKILSTIILPKDTLSALATQRAQNIFTLLTTKYHVAPSRIQISEVKATDTIRETWIGCAVGVSN